MHTIRWLLVLPAAVAAWSLVAFASLAAHAVVGSRLCPPADMVSGMCGNPTIRVALEVLTHTGVALSALVVLVVAVSVAPSRKLNVLWLFLVVGLGIAGALSHVIGAWSLWWAALGGAIAGSLLVGRVLRRPSA
ncbi:hypothetical protein C6N40_06050 [Arenimonas caeni]|jgi:hypothetical protein|uniref:DUF998 domain-containing protein n=2 Tax=Arenimonas caeni TaxID=2058085 RepID=A0A2P6M9W8_9GAMM|nr:hypothetical protein C6N40_06050 [Arenimonas caeni]